MRGPQSAVQKPSILQVAPSSPLQVIVMDVGVGAVHVPVPAVRTVEKPPSVKPMGQMLVALTVNVSIGGRNAHAFVADVVT